MKLSKKIAGKEKQSAGIDSGQSEGVKNFHLQSWVEVA